MQFRDEIHKLSYHLYGRDFTAIRPFEEGMKRAQAHVENFMRDLGLSAQGVAVKLGFSEDIGRLLPGERIGESQPAPVVESVPVAEQSGQPQNETPTEDVQSNTEELTSNDQGVDNGKEQETEESQEGGDKGAGAGEEVKEEVTKK